MDDQRVEEDSRRQSYGTDLINSTGSSITRPNVNDIVSSMSMLLSSMIQLKNTRTNDVLSSDKPDMKSKPADLYQILRGFHRLGKSSEECLIIALVLINRVLGFGNIELNPYNWKRIIIASLMIAHKSWDDYALKSIDFVYLWSRVIRSEINPTMIQMNQIEIQILSIIDFNVFVSPRLYAKYYFSLRSLLTAGKQDSRLVTTRNVLKRVTIGNRNQKVSRAQSLA